MWHVLHCLQILVHAVGVSIEPEKCSIIGHATSSTIDELLMTSNWHSRPYVSCHFWDALHSKTTAENAVLYSCVY